MNEVRRNKLVRISVVAEAAGVLSSTIRHYTDIGLLFIAATTDGGHRLYDEQETMGRLSKIKILAARGMSLPDIKNEIVKKEGWKRILVVDDEPEVGEFMVDLLKDRFPASLPPVLRPTESGEFYFSSKTLSRMYISFIDSFKFLIFNLQIKFTQKGRIYHSNPEPRDFDRLI